MDADALFQDLEMALYGKLANTFERWQLSRLEAFCERIAAHYREVTTALEDTRKELANRSVLELDYAARLQQAEAALSHAEADANWRQEWHRRLGRGAAEPEGRLYDRLQRSQQEREQIDVEALVHAIDAVQSVDTCYCGHPRTEHKFWDDKVYGVTGLDCPSGLGTEYRFDPVLTRNRHRAARVAAARTFLATLLVGHEGRETRTEQQS